MDVAKGWELIVRNRYCRRGIAGVRREKATSTIKVEHMIRFNRSSSIVLSPLYQLYHTAVESFVRTSCDVEKLVR